MSSRLFIVTGASRGIGKAITHALAASSVFSEGTVHYVLTSTKMVDLEAAKVSLEDVFMHKQGHTTNLSICMHPIDFSDLSTVEEGIKTLFSLAEQKKWSQVTLIMNHGSLGGLEYISNVSDNMAQLTTAINTNVTSCIAFASMALKEFAGKTERLDIVNVSSLAAIKPFPSWGVYCVGKAARDMLIAVIAEESGKSETNMGSTIKSLNYSPGPVNTDMQKEVRTTAPVAEQRDFYASLFESGKLVSPEDTSAKLVSILEKNEYTSGSHIDFYDK